MSDNPNRPNAGNEADESQGADARLLFARIIERLDRLEKKLDSALTNNRPRPFGGGENRRPGGSFSRPFQSNGFGSRRPSGPGRFDGSRGPGGPGRFDGSRGPGRFDGQRSSRPHQGGGKPFGNRP